METSEDVQESLINVFRDLGRIIARNVAGAISELTGEKVSSKRSHLRLFYAGEFCKNFCSDYPMVGLYFDFQRGPDIVALFLLPVEDIEHMLRNMLGRGLEDVEREIVDSGMREIGNILVCAYSDAVSNFFNEPVMPSVPYFEIDEPIRIFRKIRSEFPRISEKLLYLENEFYRGGEKMHFHFVMFPRGTALTELIKKLRVNGNFSVKMTDG